MLLTSDTIKTAYSEIINLAVDVVNMFDQANTNNVLEKDSRGKALKDSIERLRESLNRETKLTVLSKEQVNS